ncbi:MAG: aspartate aminotransferase [Rhodobacterales bacterium]|nr:MAG: aspartate aminotransferase [Rhodobacterales bacterium]
MRLSRTITGLTGGGDDGWSVFYKARAMVAAGEPVIELTIGEHDIKTSRDILDAMHDSAVGGRTGYAIVPGIPDLRDEVAKRLTERTGVPTTRGNVLITPGGQAALFASHMAVLDPGDIALYVDPYYATYPGTLRAAGGIARSVAALAENGFQPRAEDISAACEGDGKVKSLLLNSPNNPTGVIYSRETLDQIAEVAVARDFWVISDEVYDTQIWEGEHVSIRSIPNMDERTLVVGSMSKSHAMTGSRVGWIVGPEHAIQHLINLATHTTYGVAGFIQDAALYALRQGIEPEEKIAAPFLRRRDLALDLLAKQNLVKAVPPQGAMYMMLDLRATGLSGEDFANRLLNAHRIAVMPGESFGKAAAGHIRVAMTVDDDRFVAAFQTLLDFAAEQV